MELVNLTPAAAVLRVGAPGNSRKGRLALVVAKVTFSLRANRIEVDSDDPLPIFEEDLDTPLGVLPSDLTDRYPPGFEVLLLAAAYAPERSTQRTTVGLTVGERHLRVEVFGDRRWVQRSGLWGITEPLAFERMPLSWDRAFGGSRPVWVDPWTQVELRDTRNPRGRGFDPEPPAAELGRQWGAPPGYPRCEGEADLPNLEDPAALIQQRTDAPRPVCWAPIPADSTMRADAVAGLAASASGIDEAAEVLRGARAELFWRAPRELQFSGSPLGLEIVAEGVSARRAPWALAVPRLGVAVDFQVGAHTGSKPLPAHRVLLLPEEDRFAVTFARRFAFGVGSVDEERSMRLRLYEGAA